MTVGPEQVIRDDVRSGSAYPVPDATGLVKLDAMENPYALPAELRREIAEAVAATELNRYPDPAARGLRARLREAAEIAPEYDILLGNGSDEIIQMLVTACARPGAVVLAPSPTFSMYRVYAEYARVRYASVPLRQDFSLDAGVFLATMRELRPSLVFLAMPNNPTGNLFDPATVHSILEEAPGLVVIDEAYQPFAEETWLPALAKVRNLVVLRTVSKLGLAGLRLGYLVGRPEWLREIDKVRSPYNIGALTQAVAERVLARRDVLDAQASRIRDERDRLFLAIRDLPGATVWSSRANFLLVRVQDAGKTFAILRAKGVLVKSLHGADPMLANCLRVTVGTPEENRILVSALREAL